MIRSVFFKLYLGYLLLILVTAGLILAFVFHSLRVRSIENSTGNLQKLGLALRHQIGPLIENERIDELDSLIDAVGKDIQARITVVNSQGKVLADSDNTPETMENHLNRPEVITALTGVMGRSVRYSTTLGKDMVYVALPLDSPRGITAALRMSIPLEDIDAFLRILRANSLGLACLIILVSLFIAFFFSHAVSAPIRELSKASKRLAGGDFKARVNVRTHDEIQGLAESFNDMAQRLEGSFAEISSSKEELESIISSMAEGLLVLDSQGRIQLANRSAEGLISDGKTTGRYYWEVLRSPRLNDLIDKASLRPATGDVNLGDKTYLCSVTPIRSGQKKVMLLHDISEMKRLEKIKRDLVENVSHELRTPLTAIKGFTETLMEEGPDGWMDYLKIIKNHTDRLINIITDLMDLSELEAGEIRFEAEDIPIRALIEGIVTLFGPALGAKGLTARVEGPKRDVIIKGDPFRLEQMLTNLIDNAVKYTEKGGVTVSFGSSQNVAVIKVADTGIGIPREHLGRIFERFYVVDKSRSRRLGGTGLGLSIVKHIVTLHKGAISVASRPCEGTSFTILLPLAEAPS